MEYVRIQLVNYPAASYLYINTCLEIHISFWISVVHLHQLKNHMYTINYIYNCGFELMIFGHEISSHSATTYKAIVKDNFCFQFEFLNKYKSNLIVLAENKTWFINFMYEFCTHQINMQNLYKLYKHFNLICVCKVQIQPLYRVG